MNRSARVEWNPDSKTRTNLLAQLFLESSIANILRLCGTFSKTGGRKSQVRRFFWNAPGGGGVNVR